MGSESKLESVAHPLANKNTEQFRWLLLDLASPRASFAGLEPRKKKSPYNKRLSSGQVC